MSVNGQDPAPAPAKTVTLPPTRAALTWDRATDALVAAAESDEAKAKAEYDAARDRYQAARQNAHMIRQLRQLARVEGSPVRPMLTSTSAPMTAGRWSRESDACSNCGTTARRHLAYGRCTTCASYWTRHGTEKPLEAVS